MTRPDPRSWPLKGPTLLALTACASLWFAGQRARAWTEKNGEALKAAQAQEQPADPGDVNAAMVEAFGEELASYGPFAHLNPPELAAQGDDEEEKRQRPPGWVYPAFDAPAEGLHGSPAEELPRNVTFSLVGEKGQPLEPDGIRVFERTVDGESEVSLSPSLHSSSQWSFGVRRLMTGSRAFFRVEVTREGEATSQTLVLDRVGTAIDIEAGSLVF